MSILKKFKGIRASRWLAIVALCALIPLAGGCSIPEDIAGFWLYGYAYELAGMPIRSVLATGLLDFINTH